MFCVGLVGSQKINPSLLGTQTELRRCCGYVQEATCHEHAQFASSIAFLISQASTMKRERLRIWPDVTSGMLLNVLKSHVAEEGITCLPNHFKDIRGNIVANPQTCSLGAPEL